MLAADWNSAEETLARADAMSPDHAASRYLHGLVAMHQTKFDQAALQLEAAVRLDGHSAALRYQLALAYQAIEQPDRALEQLREAIRLDPLHSAAHYRLALEARKSSDQATYRKHMSEYRRLRTILGEDARTPEAFERCLYTVAEADAPPAAPPTPAAVVRFVPAGEIVAVGSAADLVTGCAVLDTTPGGRAVLAVVRADGRVQPVELTSPSPPPGSAAGPLPLGSSSGWSQTLVGDYHNVVPPQERYDPAAHARRDVFLAGPQAAALLRAEADGRFAAVTGAAGLSAATASRAAWCDYEHDGDLDLLLAGESGPKLWQNNGNGTFQEVASAVGIEAHGPATDIVSIDLDGDVATDVVLARGIEPTLVFLNQRTGRFARMAEPPGPWPPAQRVFADDLNNDGYPDVVLARSHEADVIFGRNPVRSMITWAPLVFDQGVLFDFDNDGWLDWCMAGRAQDAADRGALRIWRNAGDQGWIEASDATGLAALDMPAVRTMFTADADADGDTDVIVLTHTGRLLLLRNDGGQAGGQLKVRLVGMKTNPDGLGTRVEVHAGARQFVRFVQTVPLEIGLGGQQRVESVQTIWTNGVVDNQLDLAAGQRPVTIVEKNVAAGSCPFLYAWDGQRFRFVTDLLGNSPLGLSLRRGVVLPADPDELVTIGTLNEFPPVDGQFRIQITSEFREVLYLDEVRLLAVDHPGDVEVHSTDKLMPPPFTASEVVALSRPRRLLSAIGSDGLDRTEAVRALDGRFAPSGLPLPPPYRGMCHPMSVTLDFGPLQAGTPVALVLTGWLQYGDASTNIALSQNPDVVIQPPRLFAETASDRWTPVDVVVGLPAGKTKTIVCDLAGTLPEPARRLRLETSFEVRWDRIALLEREEHRRIVVQQRAPLGAVLDWRGFSELRSRAEGHPTTPDHDQVSDRPPWRTTPAGWCTAYGEVTELVDRRDDRLAVINAGDALTVDFPSDFASIPEGWTRTYFLWSVGWDKDADHNVETGATVAPLPHAGTVAVEATTNGFAPSDRRWVPPDRDNPVP